MGLLRLFKPRNDVELNEIASASSKPRNDVELNNELYLHNNRCFGKWGLCGL